MKKYFLKDTLLQLFAGEGGEGAPEASAQAADPGEAAPEDTPAQQPPSGQERFAMEQVSRWNTQAEQAREVYPELDLAAEIRDPRFRQLLRSGVDVETAYTVIHRDQILQSAMYHAARVARQQLSTAIRSGAARPAENGLGANSPAAVQSVANMTRKQRDDIRKRAARGERIRF